MKKETKKQGAKLSKKEIETLNKVYTIEDLKKDFLEANSDLLQLSKNIGCKYAAAHKNFDGTAKTGARTRIQLIVDGVTKQFDKVELQKLTDTYNPKTTPKTGERCKDPEALEAKAAEYEAKAAEYEAKAAELRARAEEIRKARAEAEASKAKVNEAAKGLKVDGLTVEEQKQLLKVLKMQLANA